MKHGTDILRFCLPAGLLRILAYNVNTSPIHGLFAGLILRCISIVSMSEEVLPDNTFSTLRFHTYTMASPSDTADPPNMPFCNRCKRIEIEAKLKFCAGCRNVHYCSKECQRVDFKERKCTNNAFGEVVVPGAKTFHQIRPTAGAIISPQQPPPRRPT